MPTLPVVTLGIFHLTSVRIGMILLGLDYPMFHIVQCDVRKYDQSGNHRGPQNQTESGQHTDSGRAPHGRRSIDSAYRYALMHNDSSAQETDARDHLAGNARRA